MFPVTKKPTQPYNLWVRAYSFLTHQGQVVYIVNKKAFNVIKWGGVYVSPLQRKSIKVLVSISNITIGFVEVKKQQHTQIYQRYNISDGILI